MTGDRSKGTGGVGGACSPYRERADIEDLSTVLAPAQAPAAMDFEWDEFFWKTSVCLPSWRGVPSRPRVHDADADAVPGDGVVDLVFAPEGRNNKPLTDHEVALVRWFLDHEAEVSAALIEGVLRSYPSLREQYEDLGEEPDEFMPHVESKRELLRLLRLDSINIHQISKDGLPYIGFEFACTWDPEHGLGVLMHGTRVVEVGGADTAILLWIAEDDAQKDGGE